MRCCFRGLPAIFALLTCLTSRGLEPPVITVTSADYPAWRDAIHLKVVTNSYSASLVEFSVLLEKPKGQNAFWDLRLDVHQGTNTIMSSALRSDILEPSVSIRLSDPQLANKTVQRFEFSIDRSLMENSTIIFYELDQAYKDSIGSYSMISPRIVRVSDMCPHVQPPDQRPPPPKQNPKNEK